MGESLLVTCVDVVPKVIEEDSDKKYHPEKMSSRNYKELGLVNLF